jgi:thiamine pyrophosphokinase
VQKINRALICLDGEPPSQKTLYRELRNVDCLIAADGGANWLFDYNIAPNILIGDLDGVKKSVISKLPSTIIIERKNQYSTDLEKAFTWAIQQKIKNITVMAIAGKRIDHILSNFSLLWRFHKKANIDIVHDNWFAQLLSNQKQNLKVKKGQIISLIPFSNCSGITLKGFQYPLTKATMKRGQVGVSNVASSSKVFVEIKRGHMLCIFPRDKN